MTSGSRSEAGHLPPMGVEYLSTGGARFWQFSPHSDSTVLANWANESAIGKKKPALGIDVGDQMLYIADIDSFWKRYRLELAVDTLGQEATSRIASEFFGQK